MTLQVQHPDDRRDWERRKDSGGEGVATAGLCGEAAAEYCRASVASPYRL